MSAEECEGVAAELLDRLQITEPVSPWEVTAALGIRVVAGPPGCRPRVHARPGEWVVEVDATERLGRLSAAVLHEVAHILLDRERLPNDEQHAWWLCGALLLPQTTFLRELRRAAGRVDELGPVFPHTSHEMRARRAVQLSRSLHLWVWDVEPKPNRYRVLSPGWRWRSSGPHSVEAEAMRLARDELAAVEPIGGVRAWPVLEDGWLRVLCLADGDVLPCDDTRTATNNTVDVHT